MLAIAAALVVGLVCSAPRALDAAAESAQGEYVLVEEVVHFAPLGKWQDYGWAPRDIGHDHPTRVNFSNYGGWIVARKGEPAVAREVRVEFMAPPTFGEFLELRLGSGGGAKFKAIKLTSHTKKLHDGWSSAVVPIAVLNPTGRSYNRVILRAYRPVAGDWVSIRHIGLYGVEGDERSVANDSPVRSTKRLSLVVQCTKNSRQISPMIYGIAFVPRRFRKEPHIWKMGISARRWGGNPASRYNWELGNAWNTAADWYFTNVNYTGDRDFSWRDFLQDNDRNQVFTALTIPMLGWRAKDTTSYSFPVSRFGKQKRVQPYNKDAGNGLSRSGKAITPGPASITSEMSDAASIGRWVRSIAGLKTSRGHRPVDLYLLGNEPMLWHETHRDVATEPLGYDELLKRTVRYGTAVRRADPGALIGGPSVWGWPAYLFSAKDKAAGFRFKPDRRAHGDMPFLPWYLRELATHEKRTGERMIDLLNVHFYPQGGIYSSKDGPELAARRIRSTRSLWDRTYTAESWIKEPIYLLPRLQQWADKYYPGVGISIGEYSFGGETHMSGALAVAEALGQFGLHGVRAAFYWTYPAPATPVAHAFAAYRNYDGEGARFQRRSLAVDVPRDRDGNAQVSLFASSNEGGTKMVMVALNFSPDASADATVFLNGCGKVARQRTFRFGSRDSAIRPVTTAVAEQGWLRDQLPPYSVTIYELALLRR